MHDHIGRDRGHGEHDSAARPGGRADHRSLALALAITAALLIAEVVGRLATGSLVAALALALFAAWLARRPAAPQRTFGFRGAEVLAAPANAASLVAVSVYIF